MKSKPILLEVSRQFSAVHRWLGIAVGLMFVLWFATGMVLSFVPFPILEAKERVANSEPIAFGALRVDPASALAAASADPVKSFRLISAAGQPRYVVSTPGRPVLSVSGVTGTVLGLGSADEARAIAERFTGETVTRVDGPFDYDQWVVHARYDEHRPFYRLKVGDAARTWMYVSARSGEIVQRTRARERAWNNVGAVVHWLNPTVLRKHETLWHWTIWTIAGVGIVLVIAGIWLGWVRYVNLKRSGKSGLSPFRGWLKWHHSIGLFAAVILLSFISSGWLSLDRGRFFSTDQPSAQHVAGLRGIALADAARAFPVEQLMKLDAAREIEFTALGGRPLLVVRGRVPESWVVFTDDTGVLNVSPVIADEQLLAAARSAWSPIGVLGIAPIASDDEYRLRTVPWPATARRITLADAGTTWIHIDAASGQIISVMDTSRRVYRWLVAGVHNLDFPIFKDTGPLRHVLIVMAMIIGLLFSSTGIVLAVKRLRRSLGG